MKIGALLLVVITGGVLIYGSLEFPPWGDPASPAACHVSPHYIEKAVEETSVPNLVTAVLADYRGYDTMFETIVIFTAGIASLFMLRNFRKKKEIQTRLYRHTPTGLTLRIARGGKFPENSMEFERIDSVWVPHDLIVKTTCRLIVPFAQIFALYVIAHGHHSPGGGFQGGVILGAATILFAVAFSLRAAMGRIGERKTALLSTWGVFMYAFTGLLSLFLGLNYLDYGALAALPGVGPVSARSYGVLIVEIGVGLAVMAVMVMLYYNLASAGKHDEGL